MESIAFQLSMLSRLVVWILKRASLIPGAYLIKIIGSSPSFSAVQSTAQHDSQNLTQPLRNKKTFRVRTVPSQKFYPLQTQKRGFIKSSIALEVSFLKIKGQDQNLAFCMVGQDV